MSDEQFLKEIAKEAPTSDELSQQDQKEKEEEIIGQQEDSNFEEEGEDE